MRFRSVLLLCAGIVCIAAVGGAVFVATFDINSYKGQIEAQAKAATGRDLDIKGRIGLSLSPRLTVVVEDLSLANMAGGSRPDMVTAKRLEIALDTMPLLLHRAVSVASLKLSGADLLLETDKAGHANWQLGAPAQATTPQSAAPSSGSPIASVRSIAVADSNVAYRDGATGKERTLSIGRLSLVPGSALIPIDAAGALDSVPFELKGSVGTGALAGAAHFPVTLSGRVLGFDVAVDGELGQALKAKISAGDLKPLAAALGTALPDLGAVTIDATLSGPTNALALNPLSVAVGDNVLTGDVALKLGGARPAVTANLASKRLDLGALAGKPSAAPPAGGKASDGGLFGTTPLPFDALTGIDLNAKLDLASVAAGGMTLDGVVATLTLADGVLTAKPVTAGLAGGHVTLDLVVDADHQHVTMDLTGQQVATDRLLKEFGLGPYVAAKADLAAKLDGHGGTAHEIVASLSGTGSANVGPGALAGSLIQGGLGEAVRLIAPGGNQARLTCAVAQFQISGGVATPRPLTIETNDVLVAGSGTIDLGRETLDLKMTPRPLSASLGKFAVPFRVTGPLTAPSIQPDAVGIAETAAGIAASGAIKPLAGLLPFAGTGSSGTPSAGCGSAQPAAAGTAPAASPATAPTAKPSSPGQLLNGLGRALINPGR